jgi:hypothetical protein
MAVDAGEALREYDGPAERADCALLLQVFGVEGNENALPRAHSWQIRHEVAHAMETLRRRPRRRGSSAPRDRGAARPLGSPARVRRSRQRRRRTVRSGPRRSRGPDPDPDPDPEPELAPGRARGLSSLRGAA